MGGIKRKVARDQAKKSAEQTLGTIKSVLEQATPASRPEYGLFERFTRVR